MRRASLPLVPTLVVAGVLAAARPAPAAAQRPASVVPTPAVPAGYTPQRKLIAGKELVVVFISSSWCGANADSTFKPTVRRMMDSAAAHARRLGRPLSVVGVSLDWDPADGFRYLSTFGSFDEIIAGKNWTNLAATQYVWRDSAGVPAVPQVVVLERTVDVGQTRIGIGPDRVLGRYRALSDIRTLADRGLPVGAP